MMKKSNNLSTSVTLLDLCRQNDPDAWERFLNLYKKLILYWIKIYNVPYSDSDDVLQEVMFTLSKQIVKFRKDANGKFRNWLRTIVFSRAMDYHKKNKRIRKNISLKSGSRLADPKIDLENVIIEEKKELEILGRQIISLLKDSCSPTHLEAFEMVTFNGMNSIAAAKQLNMTPENVRQINCRIRKMVRDKFGDLV